MRRHCSIVYPPSTVGGSYQTQQLILSTSLFLVGYVDSWICNVTLLSWIIKVGGTWISSKVLLFGLASNLPPVAWSSSLFMEIFELSKECLFFFSFQKKTLFELHKKLQYVHIPLNTIHQTLGISDWRLGIGVRTQFAQDPNVEVFDLIKSLVLQDVIQLIFK